jgi:TonB-dependent SusC/RagA subfamily outer membrane receptor
LLTACMLLASVIYGQEGVQPSEAGILSLLTQYFGEMPSSTPGRVGQRSFRIATDTLYIVSEDPQDLLTGSPFRSEHRIPLKGIGEVRTIRGKGVDGRYGLALEFIPRSNLGKPRSTEDRRLSSASKVDDMGTIRSGDVGQRIAGRAPGVMVSGDNGPGGGSRMRIRGPASANSSGTPLYLVDDVPVSNLNAINPDDILSVEVLKDASATALYGVRGANGVVKVTTRKGDGKGSVPGALERGEELTYSLWVFGDLARRLHRSGDAARLADLLEYRATRGLETP